MAVIQWPSEHFRLTLTSYFIDWTNRSAGRGLSGSEQIINSGTAVWRFRFDLAIEPNPERLKRFEALVSRMRGRFNTAAIPLYDAFAYDNSVSPLQEPWSDGTYHTDGTGWTTGQGVHPMVTAASAAAGASQITVTLTQPTRPGFRIGDLFSHNGFVYRVVGVAGGVTQIEPPLRAAIPSGATLQTAPVMVHARFATDGEGERARGILSYGEPVSLTFEESFDR
ncbi:hypothetical protein [Paracoccus sp. (in: a-proteobacteria)]|uniref:hypothetical protein n=1 Tax=Paracoccus sp. TaxID=267 RepID=UPI00272BCC5D|nr:hypothetical protein [Paracoccus sp. (in: a-proteobacteria)]